MLRRSADTPSSQHRAASGAVCNSFSADTDVSTPNGDIDISEIQIGDTVYAYDELTGEVEEHVVVNTFTHDDDQIVYLTIDGEEIETTPWHPFYTDEGWEDAGDLQPGDLILSLDGDYGVVDNIVVVDETQTMYDLDVETVDTFAVGDGAWVVHNCGGIPGQPELPGMGPKRLPPGVHSDQVHSVLFETNLRNGTDYPIAITDDLQKGRIRLQHNAYTNQQLKAVVDNLELHHPTEFARFNTLFPEVVDHLRNGNRYQSAPGWTWHHNTFREGVVQLIPSAQHSHPPISNRLHLRNLGGFARWVNKNSGNYLGPDVDLLGGY